MTNDLENENSERESTFLEKLNEISYKLKEGTFFVSARPPEEDIREVKLFLEGLKRTDIIEKLVRLKRNISFFKHDYNEKNAWENNTKKLLPLYRLLILILEDMDCLELHFNNLLLISENTKVSNPILFEPFWNLFKQLINHEKKELNELFFF